MNGNEMLKKLVEVLLEDGADGFYVTGSTGECFLLSEEERIKITATVAETVNGRVPIVTHVGMIGAAQAAKPPQSPAFRLSITISSWKSWFVTIRRSPMRQPFR